MNHRPDCTAAELLAGTIAVNEATDADRDAYRAHLAGCESCLRELGGERDIERVMATVARARDEERWEPALRAVTRRRTRARIPVWVTAVAAAIVVATGIGLGRYQLRPATATPPVSAAEARALAALGTQTLPRHEGRAESLAVGETATTLNLQIDARGVPLQCIIASSSGNRAKDEAICRAAMQQHYSP